MFIKLFGLMTKFANKKKLNDIVNIRLHHCHPNTLQPELETAINDQINLELTASYVYLAMASYFGKQKIALPGCQKYFLNQVMDERSHAQIFIDYISKRGGNVRLKTLEPPKTQIWESPLDAFKDALELELSVSGKILELHKLSENKGDLYLCNLLEENFLNTQIEEADKISRHITQLEFIGPNSLGIYLYDRNLLQDST